MTGQRGSVDPAAPSLPVCSVFLFLSLSLVLSILCCDHSATRRQAVLNGRLWSSSHLWDISLSPSPAIPRRTPAVATLLSCLFETSLKKETFDDWEPRGFPPLSVRATPSWNVNPLYNGPLWNKERWSESSKKGSGIIKVEPWCGTAAVGGFPWWCSRRRSSSFQRLSTRSLRALMTWVVEGASGSLVRLGQRQTQHRG